MDEARRIASLPLSLLLGGLLFASACGGNDAPEEVGRTATPIASQPSPAVTRPTADPKSDVLDAYDDYLEAYRLALLELDLTLVDGFVKGEERDRILKEIEGMRARGLAMRLVTTHSPVVMDQSEGSAVVFDEVVNNSFYVDAMTKQPPVASGSGERLSQTFYLKRAEDGWVVIRSERRR